MTPTRVHYTFYALRVWFGRIFLDPMYKNQMNGKPNKVNILKLIRDTSHFATVDKVC